MRGGYVHTGRLLQCPNGTQDSGTWRGRQSVRLGCFRPVGQRAVRAEEGYRQGPRTHGSSGRSDAMETLEACNLCGSNRFQTYAEKRGPRTGTHVLIVRCRECGLIFVNPRLTESENLALYDEAYFNGRGFDSSVNYVKLQQEGDRTREGENGGIIDKIRALKPGSEWRILDIGCGTGSLLRALVREGYRDVTGLELSEYAASIARDSSGAHVLAGDIVQTDLHGE